VVLETYEIITSDAAKNYVIMPVNFGLVNSVIVME